MHRTGWLSRTETRRGGREQKYSQGTYRMEMQLSLLGDFGIWWRVHTSVSFCGVKVVGCLCTTAISHECSLLWWVAISCPHYSDAYLLLLLSLGSWDGTCSWETTEGLGFFFHCYLFLVHRRWKPEEKSKQCLKQPIACSQKHQRFAFGFIFW